MEVDNLIAKLEEIQNAVIDMEAIGVDVSRTGISVHLYNPKAFPNGEVDWKRIDYKDGEVGYEKSVIVNGIKFFKLYTEEEYKAEVA